jgi:hypothetical protein
VTVHEIVGHLHREHVLTVSAPVGQLPVRQRLLWSGALLFRVALALEPLLVGGVQGAPSGVSVNCRARIGQRPPGFGERAFAHKADLI